MQNQQTTAVDAFVVAANGTLLALLGVDYYAMLWAFVGALLVVTQTQKMGRGRAVVYVAVSTLVGAVLGSAAGSFLGAQSRAVNALLALLGGVGWQGIVALLLRMAEGKIKQLIPGGDIAP